LNFNNLGHGALSTGPFIEEFAAFFFFYKKKVCVINSPFLKENLGPTAAETTLMSNNFHKLPE